METILTILFFIILVLIGIGAYHNYYVLNTFNYEKKKHETYLNKVTTLLWKVIFIFICLWLLYILRND